MAFSGIDSSFCFCAMFVRVAELMFLVSTAVLPCTRGMPDVAVLICNTIIQGFLFFNFARSAGESCHNS